MALQNYAGDFTLPPLSIVANTVRAVFPSCRAFRESPAPSAEEVAESGGDFDNVIMFCVKTTAAGEDAGITFREAREADYLRSLARRQYLVPKHEVPDEVLLLPPPGTDDEAVGVLRKADTENLAKWHTRSARNHWEVMRKVLPPHIWERW